MAKKKKSAKADSTPKADGGSKRQDLPGPIPAEEFEASFQKPGIGEDKATAEVGTLLADEPASDLEGYTLPDGVDPESLDADQRAELRERLEQQGTIEAAADVLSGMFESGEVDTGEGEADPGPDGEPTGEGVRWDALAEKAGVSADDVLVTVKVQGEEMEVPLSEAIAGHQRMKDYTRKTAELARHREEAEASRDRYAAGLEMLLVGLQRAGMGPDQLQAIAAEYQGVKAQITQEITAAQAEAVQEGQVKLREAYGWEDEAEWSEARDRLRSYAHDLGYSDDQLSNVTDHRLFGVLEKARRYDAARAEAGDIKRTKRRKSGTLRPGVTGSRSSKRPSEARQRLRQTGRVDDAAAALEGILGDAD